jgi:hypothetical protein
MPNTLPESDLHFQPQTIYQRRASRYHASHDKEGSATIQPAGSQLLLTAPPLELPSPAQELEES